MVFQLRIEATGKAKTARCMHSYENAAWAHLEGEGGDQVSERNRRCFELGSGRATESLDH